MRLRLVAFCGAVVACLVAGGTASADSGTISGSITPTACGPMHPITVVAGETTIDAVANMDVAANDITLELYDPSGALKAHGDTATSPEEVLYQSENLTPSVWHVQVCPFSGGVIAAPYSYNGTFSDEQRARGQRDGARLGHGCSRRHADTDVRRRQARLQPRDRGRPPADRG